MGKKSEKKNDPVGDAIAENTGNVENTGNAKKTPRKKREKKNFIYAISNDSPGESIKFDSAASFLAWINDNSLSVGDVDQEGVLVTDNGTFTIVRGSTVTFAEKKPAKVQYKMVF